jgi:hypothetical protein
MSTECFEIEIFTSKSLEEYLTGRKNPRLVAETLKFVDSHFSVKIGDILKVQFEFMDYHGHEAYLSIEHFVPVKAQLHKKIYWDSPVIGKQSEDGKQ